MIHPIMEAEKAISNLSTDVEQAAQIVKNGYWSAQSSRLLPGLRYCTESIRAAVCGTIMDDIRIAGGNLDQVEIVGNTLADAYMSNVDRKIASSFFIGGLKFS